MAFIPKIAPKQEKKIISALPDEGAHTILEGYAASLGSHEYNIGESLKRLFRHDKEFNACLKTNHASLAATSDIHQSAAPVPKNTVMTAETTI